MLREKKASPRGIQEDSSVKDLLELCMFAWLGEAPKNGLPGSKEEKLPVI